MEISKMETPSIPEWFRNREVLITGATGFMGKVLVAKLLMGCPEIKKIYVLIRPKKGESPDARLSALLEQEPFKKLRDTHPERLKKIVVVSGDTTVKDLGIPKIDAENVKNNVSVVINMAANVRFDLPLKDALNLNTRGASNVLAFSKQLKNLQSFVHVSTAFCHCGEKVLEEKWYPVPLSPEEILRLADETKDEELVAMTPQLLGEQPNTYAFTKALSEDLVYRSGLPAGIARPSIVVGSLKEPQAGWVDNMNGPTGLMIGAGKGVIRSMLCNSDYLIDVIPCDMAVNATIALAWKVGLERPKNPIFLNLTESSENPMTWRYVLDTGKKHALTNPFSGLLWYPGGGITSSRLLHWIRVFLFHTLPAYFIDALLLLSGNERFMIKVQKRVSYGLNLVQYYTTKQWDFRNEKLRELRSKLSEADRSVFFMDIREVQWDAFLLSYLLGARKYCLKDEPSTLPRARRILSYLQLLDFLLKVMVVSFLGWMIYSWVFSPYNIEIRAELDTNSEI